MKRQISDTEKKIVRQQQIALDGSLKCFISGNIIADEDEIEYDHLQAFSKDGETDIANIRIVLKAYNRRKTSQSLYEIRDNLRLETIFKSKKNHIKLQDILALKDVERKNIHVSSREENITINDDDISRDFVLFHDKLLNVSYFYGRIPVTWLENDDQEGLQPRVIDYKRLISIRDHLKNRPQLAPSIGRLLNNRLKLFDGQHKIAAQVLNNHTDVDVKIYISPNNPEDSKKLFDDLMITNLEAHSKLKQVPFYTSTLFDRLTVIYKEYLENFISEEAPERHTETNFLNFIVKQKQYTYAQAKVVLRSAIKTAALGASELVEYVAKASKDANYPLTIDLLNKTIFPTILYLNPSTVRFNSNEDYRESEINNFAEICNILVVEAYLDEWSTNVKGKPLTNSELKARRIWHKGSVLTWSPYLKSILYFALHTNTNEEREKILFREAISAQQKQVIKQCFNRLFNHPMWDEPEGEIDSLLVSAKKQDELFSRKGLHEKFVLLGQSC